MSFLLNVIVRHKCRSTHHRIAMDALAQVNVPDVSGWTDLFLFHHGTYLAGAKAPDNRFKDFCNHVLHVGERDWGGAIGKAEEWYERTVNAFAERDWREGVFSAGVLSHYVADPCQPLHTGQTEEEGAIHRAFEWAVARSYDECRQRLFAAGGFPSITVEDGPEWLARLVRGGALQAHREYGLVLEHFDIDAAQDRPEDGLDDALLDTMGRLIGRAVTSHAIILTRALAEADVAPPEVNLRPVAAQAAMEIPLRWLLARIEDIEERSRVAAAYEELVTTGKVVGELSDDDSEVRRMHAIEVIKTPLQVLDAKPIRQLGRKHGEPVPPRARPSAPPSPVVQTPPKTSAPNAASTTTVLRPRPQLRTRGPRFHLELHNKVIDAPSIGPRTAARLEAIGVKTVSDFLALVPSTAAEQLDARHISPRTIREWQSQARLVLAVPNLRGHDAQILAACGVRNPSYLARLTPEALLASVRPFALSAPGQRILRGCAAPDLAEVENWITWAQEARTLEAA